MANNSIYAAFERMWQHIVARLGDKAELEHTHEDLNEAISNITSGETEVAKATKATQDGSGNIIADTYETKVDAQTKLDEAKTYTDTSVANLVNSAPETLDTLGELAIAFEENQDVVEALNEAITNKADKTDIVQSDWNQNDETASDYVKNRPFYEESKDSLICEHTCSGLGELDTHFVSGFGAFGDYEDRGWNIGYLPEAEYIFGDEYTVYINGVSYKSTLKKCYTDTNGWYAIGLGISEEDVFNTPKADGNVPFICYLSGVESPVDGAFYKGEMYFYLRQETETFPDTTIQIYHGDSKIHYLDPKYIKDMYYEEISLQHFDITDKFTFESQTSDGITSQNGIAIISLPFVFTIGETYKFTINGTEYDSICQDMTDSFGEGIIGFGDIDAVLNEDMDSFNFFAYAMYNPDNSNELQLMTAIKTESEITEFAIDAVDVNIVKIDKKYLPDSIESINGITPDENGAISLTSLDVGASKVIEVTETDGTLSMTGDEIAEEEAAGNIIKIIDSNGKVYTRVGEKFTNMSYNPDLFNIIITYAIVGWSNSVSYKEYILPNIPAYPGEEKAGKVLTATKLGYSFTDPYQIETFDIYKENGIWNYRNVEDFYSLENNHYAIITSDNLDINPIGDEIGVIYLKYNSKEIPGLDLEPTAYTFSGTYGNYLINAVVKKDSVTVDVDSLIPTSEDITLMLSDMDIVEPMMDEEGSVLVDENGAILV